MLVFFMFFLGLLLNPRVKKKEEKISEFHEKFQEIVKFLNILRNNARKIRKMREISGICEKFYFVE